MIDRQRRSRILLVAALVLLAIAMGAGLRLFLTDKFGALSGIGSNAALVGGPFTLTDEDGGTRTDAEFRGRLMLIYFGYTYCPDLCPAELRTIGETLDRLGDKAVKLQPIFITIDPERDTAATMKKYLSHFHRRLIGLTGAPQDIAAAARAYRVYYTKVPVKGGEADNYLMDYSGLVYLVGAYGRYVTHFTPQTTAEQMAQTIAKHL